MGRQGSGRGGREEKGADTHKCMPAIIVPYLALPICGFCVALPLQHLRQASTANLHYLYQQPLIPASSMAGWCLYATYICLAEDRKEEHDSSIVVLPV